MVFLTIIVNTTMSNVTPPNIVNPPQNQNFGFVPIAGNDIGGPIDKSNQKCQVLKEKISRLLARHPSLQLRSSIKLLDKLEDCTEEQLENMLINAQNDVALVHGTPAAVMLINFFGSLIDTYFVPGFLEECMGDEDLKKDIETELFDKIGVLDPRFTIPLRTAANVLKAREKGVKRRTDLREMYNTPPKPTEEEDAKETQNKGSDATGDNFELPTKKVKYV